jgi:predicted Zn-dependent protease
MADTDTTGMPDIPETTSEMATAKGHTETVEDLFDQGIARYQAGEDAASLIPLFKEVCDRASKHSSAWTCLAWLYLLDNKPSQAYKMAKKAVKLNPQDPQARVNLAIAMLETAQTGVREHVDMASQVMAAVPELREEVENNFKDGLSRKPDWKSMKRVQSWIFGE